MPRNMILINEILNCETSEELDAIVEDINMALKSTRSKITERKKFEFTIGDVVIIDARNGIKEGIIQKINRTRAIVSIDHTTSHGTYARDGSVPFTSMKVKEKGEINA